MFSNTLINPLHPKLSMHILHTVLYTFSVADRENFLTIKRLFIRWSFPLFS